MRAARAVAAAPVLTAVVSASAAFLAKGVRDDAYGEVRGVLLVIPALAVPGPISDLFPAVDLAATGIGVVAVSIAAGMLAALVLDSRKKASA